MKSSHIFPLNLLKLQQPPFLRLRTRIDGAFIVNPFDPEVVGSTATNGICTNTDSGTGGNTTTNVETGTYADMGTHTATAFVTRGDEKQLDTVVDEDPKRTFGLAFEIEHAQPQKSPNRAAGLYLLSSWAWSSR